MYLLTYQEISNNHVRKIKFLFEKHPDPKLSSSSASALSSCSGGIRPPSLEHGKVDFVSGWDRLLAEVAESEGDFVSRCVLMTG